MLIATLKLGVVVIVPAVERLSCDAANMLVVAREMQCKGGSIRSLVERFLNSRSHSAETAFIISGVAAKLDRRRILARAAQRRAAAKAKSLKFGRKPKLTAHQQRVSATRVAACEVQRALAGSCNSSQTTSARLSVVEVSHA